MTAPVACDSIHACVIVPVFNHARTIGAVVDGCKAFSKTVLVYDDGSTDGSGAVAEQHGATVITHPKNRGKGAALRTLFQEAQRRGFRYAISLDADGQHYPEDLPALVQEAKKEEGCIVVGARDLKAANAPGSSQFGRKFSNFWVWFESGARVDDSQCGFRAYPLPETLQVTGGRNRYDFEVEILLKAAWAGLSIRSVPIQVLYPPDRVTHFRAFVDNTRISLLNTLTCLKLLLPIPLAPLLRDRVRKPGLSLDGIRRWFWLGGQGPFVRLLAVALSQLFTPVWALPLAAVLGIGAFPTWLAKMVSSWLESRELSSAASTTIVAGAAFAFGVTEHLFIRRQLRKAYAVRRWGAPSRGGYWGHLFFVLSVKIFGPRFAYFFIYPVALYFVMAAPENRRASMQYLDRVLGESSGVERWLRTYRHFLAFARVLVDRLTLGALGPSAFSLEENGVQYIIEESKAGKGLLLVTAHFGNYDVAAGLIRGRLGAPLSLVAFQNEEAQLRTLIEKNTGASIKLITVKEKSELAALDILHALREGQVVAIQGDRTFDNRVARVPFLGSEAAIPVGPFVLAALSGSPLIATFNMKIGPRLYRFVADAPRRYEFVRTKPRDEQLQSWASEYAARLEALTREYPFQWFNFYDFWAKTL